MIEQMSAEQVPAEETLTLPKVELSRTIHCAHCSHLVTQPKFAHQESGSHERTFRNPAGYSFHVLCFSQAPGCLVEGTPTSHDSWFEGTSWAFALCEGCGQHLGWRYTRAEGEAFFGLIAPRLVGWK